MDSLWVICFLLLLSLHQFPCTNAGELEIFDAIYQFGDSISDTGNFIRMNMTNVTGCTSLPYGETYFGFPTGRCSNGLLMVDFIAKRLGLPFVNPYLDTTADFSNGVDFSIYGGTALNATTLNAKDIEVFFAEDSLPVEMEWFKTHLKSINCSSSRPHSCRSKLSRSLFIMGEIGGNDLNLAFFEGKSFDFGYSLIPEVVQAISNAVQEVIDVGAKHILVPGNFPVGCIPIYRDVFASNDTSDYDDLNCLKYYNEVAESENEQIQEAIIELQLKNPLVHISYVDLYNAYKSLLLNAASLGFEEDNVFDQCCGSLSISCGTEGASLCTNPKTRISWDGTHPTHQANKYMAGWFLSNTLWT